MVVFGVHPRRAGAWLGKSPTALPRLRCTPIRCTLGLVLDRVVLSKLVQKQLQKVPEHIVVKLQAWVEAVEHDGLEEVRKIPGFHDEPLRGLRTGQRSIRLSRAYRAIYEIRTDGVIQFASVEEVNKHEY